MGEVESRPRKKRNRNTLVIVLSIVIAGAAYKIYSDFNIKRAYQATKISLEVKLDSIAVELGERIEEIDVLGGDIDSLLTLKDSIAAQRDQLQRTRRANKALIQRLGRKVKGYEELLVAKDEEIQKLKSINTQLLTENNALKVDKNKLNKSLNEAARREQQLQHRISLVARHSAENIRVFSINKRGKVREGNFRKRQAQKVKITFNLAQNDAAPVAGHKIMIQLIDPAGRVVFDIAKGSGSFQVKGKEQFYTAMQEIVFDNSKQALSFVYDKGATFEKGDYKIILLADTYEIGRAAFNVR